MVVVVEWISLPVVVDLVLLAVLAWSTFRFVRAYPGGCPEGHTEGGTVRSGSILGKDVVLFEFRRVPWSHGGMRRNRLHYTSNPNPVTTRTATTPPAARPPCFLKKRDRVAHLHLDEIHGEVVALKGDYGQVDYARIRIDEGCPPRWRGRLVDFVPQVLELE